jgi:hypothetical protein
MLIEINYNPREGSICPFCGKGLNPLLRSKVEGKYGSDERDILLHQSELWWCICEFCETPCVVLTQFSTENLDIYFGTRIYMLKNDFEDYFGVSIPNGPYEVPTYHEEDWRAHDHKSKSE